MNQNGERKEMDINDIKVSIVCNTYNHENYIRDALEGFIMQKTDFAYEVLIHDDASTDKTADIIREYEAKYPDIIKPIYQTENQYSKKISVSVNFQYPRVKGKYIALCEGDDYWTDSHKLQKQYDVMEAHPELDMCAHAARLVNVQTNESRLISPSNEERILSAEEVIQGGGGYVTTASLFYRKSLDDNFPEFRKIKNYDYTMQIHGALRGGMYFITDVMSVYRWMVPGSWTMRVQKVPNKQQEFVISMRSIFLQLDKDTDGKYSNTISRELKWLCFYELAKDGDYKSALSEEYRVFFKKLPLIDRVKIRIYAYFPWLRKFYNKLRGRNGK